MYIYLKKCFISHNSNRKQMVWRYSNGQKGRGRDSGRKADGAQEGGLPVSADNGSEAGNHSERRVVRFADFFDACPWTGLPEGRTSVKGSSIPA